MFIVIQIVYIVYLMRRIKRYIDIDDYRLGAWKLESKFKRGKYLRQKMLY